MPSIILLIGPPGSGKSTLAAKWKQQGWTIINQDSQGKDGHWNAFQEALKEQKPIVIDRMNFNKEQRAKYIIPAKAAGYDVEVDIVHESLQTCMRRITA